MNNGVYALPGFMAPAAKNWKSQLLTNEDGSVNLCVYVGKPGTKVYYSLGIPGWRWGFIKDAQYFIDKGYPQEVIDEVSKFADYLEEEVTELPEGTVIPDIIINGWPVPITESPIEGKVYWILNIPKFVLPAGDTEVQISANGKLLKYTITRPDFSIHNNVPGYTICTPAPGGGDGSGGLTDDERALLNGAAQRDADNMFTAANTFTGSVDMSAASVTPPSGWNVGELTAEAVQAVVPMAWSEYTTAPKGTNFARVLVIGNGAVAGNRDSLVVGDGAKTIGWDSVAVGNRATAAITSTALGVACSAGTGSVGVGQYHATNGGYSVGIGSNVRNVGNNAVSIGQSSSALAQSTAVGYKAASSAAQTVTIGALTTQSIEGQNVESPCTTEGTGSITIGAGASTLNNGSTESSNSVTIGCKAENKGADSVVIGAQTINEKLNNIVIGTGVASRTSHNILIGNGINTGTNSGSAIALGHSAHASYGGMALGHQAHASNTKSIAINGTATGYRSVAILGTVTESHAVAIGDNAKAADKGVIVFNSSTTNGSSTDRNTQLYFSGVNTPLANEYYNGEAFMGYTVTDANNNVLACGTRRLSELFTDNTLNQAATIDEETGEYVIPKVFHPSNLDLAVEESTDEYEEYTPLPVWPIVEPEIEDINLINAE